MGVGDIVKHKNKESKSGYPHNETFLIVDYCRMKNSISREMEVRIKLLNGGIMPTKGSEKAAGYDLYVPDDVLIPYGRFIVKLGFILQLPEGYKAEIDPRSGYSAKGFEGVSLDGVEGRFNCDVIHGLIDEDYRGEVGVIVKNEGQPFRVKKQQRIAQMTISKVDDVVLTRVLAVDETVRNDGGFGSTGK